MKRVCATIIGLAVACSDRMTVADSGLDAGPPYQGDAGICIIDGGIFPGDASALNNACVRCYPGDNDHDWTVASLYSACDFGGGDGGLCVAFPQAGGALCECAIPGDPCGAALQYPYPPSCCFGSCRTDGTCCTNQIGFPCEVDANCCTGLCCEDAGNPRGGWCCGGN